MEAESGRTSGRMSTSSLPAVQHVPPPPAPWQSTEVGYVTEQHHFMTKHCSENCCSSKPSRSSRCKGRSRSATAFLGGARIQ
eukprot:9700508-Alexandrium_andersonii.AAC.1